MPKFDQEFQDKLQEFEARKPVNRQLRILEDIATISQETLNVLDASKKASQSDFKALGALLDDARQQLTSINQKETPESPDFSKPIVTALSKLEKALQEAVSKETPAPIFKPEIKVDSPQVSVNSPDVSVDTRELEKIIKTDIPKAFEKAVKALPKTPEVKIPTQADYSDKFGEMIDWLKSIDTATRIKPTAPNTIKVTNPDGSSIGSLSGSTSYESYVDTTTDTNLVYLGKATPGSAIGDAAWQIKRYNKTTGQMSFADDITTFTKTWDDRASYSY